MNNLNLKLIGLHGAAESGKDTSADCLVNFERLAFAKPLKDAAKILFNLTDEQLYDQTKKNKIILDNKGEPLWKINGKPASPRLMLQWLGTDILRKNVSDDFFTKSMKQRILESNCDTVITDVRFPIEAELIRELGGKVIKIVRPDNKKIELSDHVSEQTLPDELVDIVVINDGTVADLHEKILDLIS